MANITVRNIPESVFEKLKLLSEIDRRSLNNELLMAIENGIKELEHRISVIENRISPEIQASLWSELSGKWKDRRSKDRQIKDIYESRSMGREVSL